MPCRGGQKFVKRAVDALQGDTELAALAKHTASSLHIGATLPNVKGRTPYVGVDYRSFPFIGNVTRVQSAFVEYHCTSVDPLTCVQLADRIECLLHGDGITQNYNGYFWNFSGPGVTIKECSFLSRSTKDFDKDTDTYSIKIIARVIWIDQDCTDLENEPICN